MRGTMIGNLLSLCGHLNESNYLKIELRHIGGKKGKGKHHTKIYATLTDW